jgi:hypothetical protein
MLVTQKLELHATKSAAQHEETTTVTEHTQSSSAAIDKLGEGRVLLEEVRQLCIPSRRAAVRLVGKKVRLVRVRAELRAARVHIPSISLASHYCH